MSNRRDFLKYAAIGGAGVALPFKWSLPAFASVTTPQTPLSGGVVPRYVDPLPTFLGKRVTATSINAAMQEFQQQILPATFPKTTVWGYNLNNKGPSFSPRASIVVRKTLNSSSQSLRTLLCVISCGTLAAKRNPSGVFAFQVRTTLTFGVA